MKTLDLKDIGRPKSLRIPIPEDGGIVVLTGCNGSGKSTTLEAVHDAVTDRKDKRSRPRDGVSSGSLTGCGITMKVGRKITRAGELTVETLDGGRLSIADLVSPPFKGAEEADGRRIKALVQLAGVEADPMLFAGLLPNFRDVVDVSELDDSDILKMSDQIKRKIEGEARSAEGRRDIAKQQALACEEAAAGIPVDVETDAGKLQLACEDAVRRAQQLISSASEAKRRNAEILHARQKITAATSGNVIMSLDQARDREAYVHNQFSDATAEVEALEKKLQAARWNLERTNSHWDQAKSDLGQTERFLETLAEWEKTVSAGELTGPAADELAAADEAVTASRLAIEAGAAARAAKVKLFAAEKHRTDEVDCDFAAEALRAAAAGVDQILTDQIETLGCPLRVEAGRLLTDTDRGPTFYAELSDGERWRMAVKIAVKAVGPGGLLVIPQAAYSELQPKVRVEIDWIAMNHGVVILTALATDDDEIKAVLFKEMEVVTA